MDLTVFHHEFNCHLPAVIYHMLREITGPRRIIVKYISNTYLEFSSS